MRAVGYIRVSRVGGREGDRFISPALQREQIELAARREGLDVVEVIEELDASGGDASRPGWNRAIEMVESGEVSAIVVWNLSRFSRSVKDALGALDRIREAGGRLVSATEAIADDPEGELSVGMVLQFAQYERSRARRQFRAATANAVARGIHVAGTVPLGYVRGPDRRLVPDPETAPIVLGLFERRAKGWSWVKLARWATEQLAPLTPPGEEPRVLADNGVAGMIRNAAYLGQARYGDVTRDDAHEAIVPRGLWRRCQAKARPSARTGKLTERFLLQGLATCASCGRAMYLSGSGRRNRSPYYLCRQARCSEHAYAQAQALDDFVLNTLDERLNPADPSQWIAMPGDDREVEEAEAAAEEAKADLDGFLADTKLRRVLGAGRYAETVSDYVAALNKAEVDLAEARERSGGGFELVGRLWLQEWGWAERKEWVERMVRSVVVSKGRELLSRRVEVELR